MPAGSPSASLYGSTADVGRSVIWRTFASRVVIASATPIPRYVESWFDVSTRSGRIASWADAGGSATLAVPGRRASQTAVAIDAARNTISITRGARGGDTRSVRGAGGGSSGETGAMN